MRSIMSKGYFGTKDPVFRPLIHPPEGSPYAQRWPDMTRFEKVCWLWSEENRYLRENIPTTVRFECLLRDYDYFCSRVLEPISAHIRRRDVESILSRDPQPQSRTGISALAELGPRATVRVSRRFVEERWRSMDTSSTGVATATERTASDHVQEHALKTWFRSVPWARVAQVLIAVSLAVVLLATVRDLGNFDFTLLAKPYAASLGLALAAVLSLFLVWYRLLARISHQPVPLWVALRVFAYSWLGRYVPGRVWSSVGKVYVGARLGLSTEELTLASLLEQILSNVAHTCVALFFLLFLFSGKVDSPAILISLSVLLLGAGLVVLQPPVLRRIVNRLLKRVGCGVLEQEHFPGGEEIILFGFGVHPAAGSLRLVILADRPCSRFDHQDKPPLLAGRVHHREFCR